MEGGKPENPEKNPRSTGEINYDNSIHISPMFENQHEAIPRWSPIQLQPVRLGLTWNSVVKGNVLTEYQKLIYFIFSIAISFVKQMFE